MSIKIFRRSNRITSGVKATGVDAGKAGDISVTDDFIYICVSSGIAGVAIWKKVMVFQT